MEYDYSPDQEEDLKYRYLCAHDMEAAKNIIDTIKEKTKAAASDRTLRFSLLQVLVVTYFRPFTKSRGRRLESAELESYKGLRIRVDKVQYRAHRISKRDYVPLALEDLHQRVDVFRNQQCAHTDPSYYNVRIANLGTAEDPWWTFGLKRQELEYLDENFGRLEELVTTVLVKLRAELKADLDYLATRVIHAGQVSGSGIDPRSSR